jgi:2-haloacid dehalogenase
MNDRVDLLNIRALAFDTGGTILDWHGGLVRAFIAAGAARGLSADWHAVVNEYRRRSLKAIVGQVRPAFNFDDVHRRVLDEVIADHGLVALTPEDRDAIWGTWHKLDAWPGFAPALARLKSRFIVASFTLLTTRLVIEVSRRNGFVWDAILSCEMIGHYKTRPDAYDTAARWLQLDPSEILMVACHNFDLDAARARGYRTAFVRRPDEWGPAGPPDPEPNPAVDVVVDDFDALARRLGC